MLSYKNLLLLESWIKNLLLMELSGFIVPWIQLNFGGSKNSQDWPTKQTSNRSFVTSLSVGNIRWIRDSRDLRWKQILSSHNLITELCLIAELHQIKFCCLELSRSEVQCYLTYLSHLLWVTIYTSNAQIITVMNFSFLHSDGHWRHIELLQVNGPTEIHLLTGASLIWLLPTANNHQQFS